MNLKELNKSKLKPDRYYLVNNLQWSPSGYTIAQYINGQLICETCGREIPFEDIEGILELD